MPASVSSIILDKLVVRYGAREVLRGISADLSGRSIGLLGPNGAGKSTLIKTLLGFVKPHSGRAEVLGCDVVREPLRLRQFVGYMPESESYIPGMSAVRQLRFLAELSGLPSRSAMERAHEVLYFVGMGEMRYRPVETLSLGNQQRVKLAQALVGGPKLLILDEPTNALDPDGREEMLRLVRDIREFCDAQIIMCSHILRDIEFCCDTVTVIHRGQIVLNGNIEELRGEDRRIYDLEVEGDRERFLGAISAQGWRCEVNERGTFRVHLPEQGESRALFRIASELGVQLRHFHHKKDSLEEIFVTAIEDSERSAAHAGT